MHAAADLDPERPDGTHELLGTRDRPRRSVEPREEAVARRVLLPAAEALELFADDRVVPLHQLLPSPIAQLRLTLRRADGRYSLVMIEVVAAILGSAFLGVFYAAVRTKWPQSYFSITDFVARRVSASPIKYAAFRFGPVVTLSGFTAVTMDRLGESALLAVGLMTSLHGAATNGRGLLDAARFRSQFARTTQTLLNAAILLGVFFAAGAGWLLSKSEAFQGLVPAPADLSSALWTALLAGTIGAFLIEVSRGDWVNPRHALNYSRAKLGDELWGRAAEAARTHGADEALVKAILLTENLARPSWVRRLERLKGRLFKHGTYGVMQIKSEAPISDGQSIDLAVAQRLHGTQVRADSPEEVSEFLRRYNPNPHFVSLATDFYFELRE